MNIARLDTETAAYTAHVQPATIRQWVRRGHITRHHDGIDLYELMHWIDTIRNDGKARGAVHATRVRHETRRSA